MKMRNMLVALMCLPVAGCDFFDPPLVKICSQMLVERLKVPSSYRKISHQLIAEPIEKQNFVWSLNEKGIEGAERERALAVFDDETKRPTQFTIVINYDAQNAFGAALRGTATCRYLSDDRQALDIDSWKMTIEP